MQRVAAILLVALGVVAAGNGDEKPWPAGHGALVPIAGGIETSDLPLEEASLEPAPAAACVPALEARPSGHYVALAWSECPGAASYQVLRGVDLNDLRLLVAVNHASHVDIAPFPVGFYAVRAADGPASAPVVIALG